jgi:hypothetical protein
VEELDANRRDSPGVLASRASLFQASRVAASLQQDSPANYRNGIPRKGREPVTVDRERRTRNDVRIHASRTTRLHRHGSPGPPLYRNRAMKRARMRDSLSRILIRSRLRRAIATPSRGRALSRLNARRVNTLLTRYIVNIPLYLINSEPLASAHP